MDKHLVIKQDINFLDKPLWFVEARHDGRGFVWKDIDGYDYRTGFNVPEKIDGLILLYLMWKSQQLEFQETIVLSRYEVLKACDLLNGHSHYYKRLEESIKRWKNVAIEFKGTFYDGKAYKSYLFGIFDEAKIRENDGKLEIEFNKSWLTKIRETQFFKYINFEYCKLLKRPVSMRLYEILCKTFKGRDEWQIHVVKLGEKLTISKREVHTREGKKEVLYASDVLTAIKPAINEINRKAAIPDLYKKLGIPPEDTFAIIYKITWKKQDRIITFHKQLVKNSSEAKPARKRANQASTVPPNQAPSELPIESMVSSEDELLQSILDPKTAEKIQRQIEKKENALRKEHLKTLCGLLKKRTTQITQAVESYYDQKGIDYVLWNIRYANENARSNYSTYLQKALKENWAEEWKEEEQKNQEVKIQERKAKREAAEKEDSQEREKAMFMEMHDRLDREIKENLAQQAQSEESPQSRNSTMPARIRYVELVREHFRKQGTIISREATGLLAFIKQVTSDIF